MRLSYNLVITGFNRLIIDVDVVVECTHLNRSVFTFFLVCYPMANASACNLVVAVLFKKIVSKFPYT